MELSVLVEAANKLMQPQLFEDYCPNGLQVEGCSDVQRLITGVTASQKLIEAAVELKADVILVHHGYFWKGEDPCVVGVKGRRLSTLLKNDISLLAYHLPLDAHPELGNNAQLAKLLGIEITGQLFTGRASSVGNVGRMSKNWNAGEFSCLLADRLGREPQVIVGGSQSIQTVAWCTGAAQDYIEQAALLGVDAFISGEISERTVHLAEELGIHYFAAGHHATERYGVKALGESLAQQFQLRHDYIEIDNPV